MDKSAISHSMDMAKGCHEADSPMPYPPHGILRFYTTDMTFSVEYKPLNIAVNIQWVLTGNYSCRNMSILNIWCDLWYKSKTTWLMDKYAISHSVDMAKGCHEAYGLVTSLCHIHLMGYCVFIDQPCGLAIVFKCFYGSVCGKVESIQVHFVTMVTCRVGKSTQQKA